MRIAMMVSGGGVSGAIVHCLQLSKFLASRGHNILLLHRPGAWVARQPGLERIELFATSFSRKPRELIRVAQRINTFRPDVGHTHSSSAHSYGAAARFFLTIPVVATAHAMHTQLHWALNNLVIATSPRAAAYHHRRNLVPSSRIETIPNFVDTQHFLPADSETRRAARSELGIPPSTFVVGSVGHLIARKRPADLVRAFAHVVRAREHCKLLLVGGWVGDTPEKIRQVASRLGVHAHVVFAGGDTSVEKALAAMDIFALASGQESGPLAILEAMAVGLPVLATKVGMVPEFVLEGTTGHLADIGDTATLGRHMLGLLMDDGRRSALGRAGRARVEREFAIEVVAPRIEAALARAASIEAKPLLGALGRVLAAEAVAGERRAL
jgi:glycosyltransferase involved in cell wall biosynthesis